MSIKTLSLSTSAIVLTSCATPFATSVGQHNFESPETEAAVMVGELRGYARETLINDRRREVDYLTEKLEESKTVKFEPQLKRQVESLTGIVGQLQASLDPAGGDAFERTERLQELEYERQVLVAERTLLLAQKELEALRDSSVAPLAPKTGPSTPVSDPQITDTSIFSAENIGATGVEATGDAADADDDDDDDDDDQQPATVTSATPITTLVNGYDNTDIEDLTLGDVETLQAISKRAEGLLAKISGGSPIRGSSTSLSPRDDFRDRQDYRAELRAALSEANLDDVHDLDGNALYRLQTRITVLPNKDSSQFGATQLTFKAPKLEDDEIHSLFWQWLGYMNNVVNQTADDSLAREFRSLARAASSIGLVQIESNTGENSYIVAPEDVVELYALLQCRRDTTRQLRSFCAVTQTTSLSTYKILNPALTSLDSEAIKIFDFGTYGNDNVRFKNNTLETEYLTGGFRVAESLDEALHLRSILHTMRLTEAIAFRTINIINTAERKSNQVFEQSTFEDSMTYGDQFENFLQNQLAAIYRDLYLNTFNGNTQCPQKYKNLPKLYGEIQFLRNKTSKLFSEEDYNEFVKAPESQHAQMFCDLVFDKISLLLEPSLPNELRLDGFGKTLKPFRNAILHDNGIARGKLRIVDAMPHQQVQRISSTMGAANAVDLAFAVRAQASASGLKGILGANFVQQSLGRIEAIESTPIVIGFTDSATGGDYESPATAGWIAGPKLIPSKNGKELAFQHTVENHPVSVDVSAPGWWPKVDYTQTSRWIGNWSETSKGKLFTKTGDNKQIKSAGLSNNATDMEALTRKIAGLSVPLNSPTIKNVSPSNIRICKNTPYVTLQISGRNIWQSPRVFLNGREAETVSILPNMNGLNVSFNLTDLPKIDFEPDSTIRREFNATVTVWTRDNEATEFIKIDYDADNQGFCSKSAKSVTSPASIDGNANQNWIELGLPIQLSIPDRAALKSQANAVLQMRERKALVGSEEVYKAWKTVSSTDDFSISSTGREVVATISKDPTIANGAIIGTRIAVTPRANAEERYINFPNLRVYYMSGGDRVKIPAKSDGYKISGAADIVNLNVELPPEYSTRFNFPSAGLGLNDQSLVIPAGFIGASLVAKHSGGTQYDFVQQGSWTKRTAGSLTFSAPFVIDPASDMSNLQTHLGGDGMEIKATVDRVRNDRFGTEEVKRKFTLKKAG